MDPLRLNYQIYAILLLRMGVRDIIIYSIDIS